MAETSDFPLDSQSHNYNYLILHVFKCVLELCHRTKTVCYICGYPRYLFPGDCCNKKTCQLKAVSTVCREQSAGRCDLTEYCDGRSEWCPEDTYKYSGMFNACTAHTMPKYQWLAPHSNTVSISLHATKNYYVIGYFFCAYNMVILIKMWLRQRLLFFLLFKHSLDLSPVSQDGYRDPVTVSELIR